MVEDGALNELAEEQPLLLAIVDAVFAAEGGQEVVEPEEYGDLPRAEAGAVSAVVCPLPIDAGSPGDVSRPDRSAPRRWRRAGSEGAIVQFQLLRRRAAEGSIGFPRHIRDLTGKVVLIQQDEEVVQGPLVIGGTQGSDGEVWLVGDMAHGMDKPAEPAACQ